MRRRLPSGSSRRQASSAAGVAVGRSLRSGRAPRLISSRVFLPTPRMTGMSPATAEELAHGRHAHARRARSCASMLRPSSAIVVSAWSSTCERPRAARASVAGCSACVEDARQARSISSALSNRCAESRRRACGRSRQAVAHPGSNARPRPSPRRRSCAGSCWPSPQRGSMPGGHLVERHAGRVALGGQVPARRPAQRQERVEVAGACRPGCCSAGVRASEKSNRTRCSLPLLAERDADVVGLDVAVGDAACSREATAWSRSSPNRWSSSRPSRPSLRSRWRQRLVAGLAHQDGVRPRISRPRAGRR